MNISNFTQRNLFWILLIKSKWDYIYHFPNRSENCKYNLISVWFNGFFHINDMQTPPALLLPPPQKDQIFFGPKCCAMFWNKWKINFAIYIFPDMVAQIFTNSGKKKCRLKDAQCPGTDFLALGQFAVKNEK